MVRVPLNVPNTLTFLRLLLAVPAVVAAVNGHHRAALAVFAFAAATDGLDGYLARRLDARTQFGAYLDPVADKCLLSGMYLALGLSATVPWWFVGLVLGRDLYILAGAAAFYRFSGIRKFPPSRWGKLSTFTQILAAALLMGRNAFGDSAALAVLAHAAIWPATAATLWSAIHYTWRAAQMRARPIDAGDNGE
jgi:cardiolipin synthase (CMP-forming)